MSDSTLHPPIESPILTPLEAAHWLRLTEDRSESAALESLTHMVKTGRISPLKIGARRMFNVEELRRYINDQAPPRPTW